MTITVALVGNPNSGKTTLFNQFTGNHQYVGNWPGVTVEKKEGTLKSNKDVHFVDLPGIYSLSPYTNEEVVARKFLAEGDVDVIIDVADATNLERNLYLTSQLMEFGVPVVVALNQMDIVEKRGYTVKAKEISEHMGVPVVEISALKGTGIDECAQAAIDAAAGEAPNAFRFSPELEKYLAQIEEQIPESVSNNLKRYYAIKAFEGDEKAMAELPQQLDVSAVIEAAEKEFDDDAEGIITNERYKHITSFIDKVYKRTSAGMTTSEKIDRVVTNRILALPIFIVIIALVYYIAINTVGGVATDWANDGVFGDGWYLDPAPIVGIDGSQAAYDEAEGVYTNAQGEIAEYVAAAADKGVAGADEMQARIDDEEAITADTPGIEAFLTAADKAGVTADYTPVDEENGELLTSEEDGAAYDIDAAEVRSAMEVPEPDHADYGIWIPGIPVLCAEGLAAIGVTGGWVYDLLMDGIIAGVGAVLGFVPQIMVLFFLLAILEGCGYMARVAFILDRVFRRFGLSGKSFIPLLIGTGCGVPGIMASRTIESESSRRLTVMTTTFMPCSAKLPIIALFAGAIFAGAGWLAPVVYFVGIASVIISGIMLRKTKPFLGDTTPFVMELPEYRLPRFVDLLRSMWERAWAFIKKAFLIILPSVVLVWFLSTYGFENGTWCAVSDMENSILATIGGAIAWVFTPLGWGDSWQAASAAITGLIAKENLVGTFGVLYTGGAGLWASIATAFVPAAALSMMFFNLLCAPCFAAMSAIYREMGGGKWFWAAIGYQTLYAYCVALCIFQFGGLATGVCGFSFWTVVAILVVCVALFMLFRPAKKLKAVSKPAAQAA